MTRVWRSVLPQHDESSGSAERLRWMREARFGLFIHWGLYSVAARHEWVKQREPRRRRVSAVLRALRPGPVRPPAVGRAGPAGRDAVRGADDQASRGFLPLGLGAHRLQGDQHAGRPGPGAAVAGGVPGRGAAGGLLPLALAAGLAPCGVPDRRLHPQRDDEAAKAAAKDRDIGRYAEYLHAQVSELLTGYGPVDYLFFDFSYPERTWGGKGRNDWRSAELMTLVRSLQRDVVVNDRLDLDDGDVVTPEQYQQARPLAAGTGCGKRARRSTAAGGMTVTTWTGRAPIS